MNRNQWYVLSIGMLIFGLILLWVATPACLNLEGDFVVACYIRKYAYAIPGLISLVLGLLFMYCAWLEPKIKK